MKSPKIQKLIRRQVSKKLDVLTDIFTTAGEIASWSKYVRNALGMTGSQLAKRLGIAQNSLSALEKREIEGRLTLNKLREMANAMECDLVYSFIPRKPIEDIVTDQARRKAQKSITQSNTHMSLENQKVTTNHKERLSDLTEDKKYSKYLWDPDE